MRSDALSQVSRSLFTFSTGIVCHTQLSHHSIQTNSVHLRICEHVERKTSQIQDHCGEEAAQVIGKFAETGLKRMKVKLATSQNEREAII